MGISFFSFEKSITIWLYAAILRINEIHYEPESVPFTMD